MNLTTASVGYADPDFYPDPEPEVRQLRADFAHYYQLLEIAPYAIDEQTRLEFTQHAEGLATRWGSHDDRRLREMWQARHAAVLGWESRPEQARAIFDQIARSREAHDLVVDDQLWEALVDARRVTGHGPGPLTGSSQDADHRYPHLRAETYRDARPAPGTDASLDVEDVREPWERTLGAPRNGTVLPDLTEVDAVIAATDAALDAEERAADLDTGYDARSALLPRAVREAPVSHLYLDTAARDARHAALLRQVQDLAAEHANLAFDGDPSDDQARLHQLETLRQAISDASREARHAGIAVEAIEHAYHLGRDGIYWSTEPADPHLGRIAQLTEQRDHARAETDRLRAQLQQLAAHEPRHVGPETTVAARDPGDIDPRPEGTDPPNGGFGIRDAVHTALPPAPHSAWQHPGRSDDPQRYPDPAAHPTVEAEP
ncbi:hypothetical protein ACWDSJ_26205 [Nocardia sp. NPDC003482]